MKATELVRCRGHPLVQGTHPSTFEVTRDQVLTLQGDCIIGIYADKGAVDLDPSFKEVISRDDAVLVTRLSAGGVTAEVYGRGCSKFTLDHPTDLVWRRSTFVCGRTVGIACSLVARTLPRALIAQLRQEGLLTVEMTAIIPD
jgi:uncharacterized protein